MNIETAASRSTARPRPTPHPARRSISRLHPVHVVRACREVQVNDVIGMAGRGHFEKIVFDFDDPRAIDLRCLR